MPPRKPVRLLVPLEHLVLQLVRQPLILDRLLLQMDVALTTALYRSGIRVSKASESTLQGLAQII